MSKKEPALWCQDVPYQILWLYLNPRDGMMGWRLLSCCCSCCYRRRIQHRGQRRKKNQLRCEARGHQWSSTPKQIVPEKYFHNAIKCVWICPKWINLLWYSDMWKIPGLFTSQSWKAMQYQGVTRSACHRLHSGLPKLMVFFPLEEESGYSSLCHVAT